MKVEEKRVLIVSSEFPPQPGGIGNHAYNLAKQLQINQFNVQVLSDNRSLNGKEELEFDENLLFKVYRVKCIRFRLLMYLNRLLKLFKLIKSVDIVIASGKFSLWIVAICSLFYKRKFIAILHGSEVNFKHKFLKASIDFSLKRFVKIITVSNYTKSLINHLNLENIQVIPNGFDLEKWTSHETNLIALKGNPKMITIGNVTERKGQLNVIKHLPELINFFPELHYHCVGIPTEVNNFLKVAKNLNVNDYVTFHGRVDDASLHELLISSDVFVMLSSTTLTGDVEGFGIAILEANALGIPAIGSIDCGIEDAINQNKSGILIEYSNSSAFINALKTIFENKSDYSNHAKSWAKAHNWNLIIKKYIEVLNS